MAIKPEELKKEIKKKLKNYEESEIEISGKNYFIFLPKEEKDYIFVKDEDINLFEGFIFAEVDKKAELSNLLNYKPAVSGYVGRIGIIIYKNEEIIVKDYRANKQIRKTIAKINTPFLKKLKKALEDPKSKNISALFSRSDVIEEFYVLYKKCREFLLRNVKGISEEESREKLVDNFMMQMLTLWYLQEKGFFNKDKHYFITKFKELKQKKLTGGFKNYYEFLRHFFRQISGNSDQPYVEDKDIGKCVVIGPAVFLNKKDNLASSVPEIPDKCFYQKGVTEKLINLTPKGKRKMISEKDIDFDVPLLNLFESRDWVDGDIDEYVLGSLYEKLITYMERKRLGAFYTPEDITSYICKNTIEPYLVDRINEEFGKSYKNIDEVINAGEKKELLKLFEFLQNIKILDPAVGSAHFLESAINVLVDIYRKLRDKAKEVGIDKLEILVANEDGKIKPLNLLDIPEKEGLFEVYVKFFIILSRNIYGVDINSSALKVARARLFLTLAKHFDVNAGIFIRFPNVHFNLMEGNSLIGYVEIPRGKGTKQLTLDFEFGDDEIKDIHVKVDKELKEYLPEIAKSLKIEGDIVKEVEEMNRILASKKIKWNEFEKVLKTKEKLIQVLVASLNSRYAVKLNKLLREITDRFNKKLDEKFAEEYRIDLVNLKKIKTFHWIFEFPEVFLRENPGFDVVVGNPPYVRQEDVNHIIEGIDYKEILSKLYNPFENTFDFSMFFILRSLELTREDGYHSFIITNKWLRARYGKKIRKCLKEKKTSIKKIVDFNGVKVFVGATVDTMIYVIKKEKPYKDNKIFYNNPKSLEDIEKGGYYVKQYSLEDDVWNFIDERILEIKKWLEKVGVPLKELDVKILYGIKTGFNEAFIIDDETRKKLIKEDAKSEELIKPLLRGRDIGRYYVDWKRLWIIIIPAGFTKRLFKKDLPLKEAEELFKKEYPSIYKHFEPFKYKKGKGLVDRDDQGDYWWELRPCDYYEEFEKPKIVWQEISVNSRFSWDLGLFYITNNAYIMTNASKMHLMILNSKLIEEIFKQISQFLSKGYRYTKQYIEKIPIRLPNNIQPYETLADYLLFLNIKEDFRNKYKEIINFFDREIADSLVYELYFKEKFIEDSKKAMKEGGEPIYPKLGKGPFLIDLVAKHLKPIDYDNYAKLAYSIEQLSEEEKQRMEKMKRKHIKTIKEVIEAIKADKEIIELIEKIKSHEWVKVIEGGN